MPIQHLFVNLFVINLCAFLGSCRINIEHCLRAVICERCECIISWLHFMGFHQFSLCSFPVQHEIPFGDSFGSHLPKKWDPLLPFCLLHAPTPPLSTRHLICCVMQRKRYRRFLGNVCSPIIKANLLESFWCANIFLLAILIYAKLYNLSFIQIWSINDAIEERMQSLLSWITITESLVTFAIPSTTEHDIIVHKGTTCHNYKQWLFPVL